MGKYREIWGDMGKYGEHWNTGEKEKVKCALENRFFDHCHFLHADWVPIPAATRGFGRYTYQLAPLAALVLIVAYAHLAPLQGSEGR